MTAEIAIMNREAVALAADSAVTMEYAKGQKQGQKICTSANKLFTLSKYHPVGIMIYANASFMNIPWESIIKIYRKRLGNNKFDTLQEYAEDFIAFLNGANPLFPEDQQREHLKRVSYSYFYHIWNEIYCKIKYDIDKKNSVTETEIKSIAAEVIRSHYKNLMNKEFAPSLPKEHVNQVVSKYVDVINSLISEVFAKIPINEELMEKLRMISGYLWSKDINIPWSSGIVIAGFGEKDIFPSVKSFTVEGIVNDNLKYRYGISSEITYEKTAAIVPFAQSEMVATFMEGIDPNLNTQIENYLSESFDDYFTLIAKVIGSIDDKQNLEKRIKKASKEILENYKKHINGYKSENHIQRITKVVAMLPKDELAAMAESLVNLTSFKRKVTTDSETVGGPIDVAVISKGDGFIWIQRKHYFKAELNPQFFTNYYRGDTNGTTKDEGFKEEQ